MTRQTLVPRDAMPDDRKEAFDKVSRARNLRGDGHMGGPFDAWILNPGLGLRITGLGGDLRFKLSVDRRQIELVILVTGHFWQAQFEWFAHEPMAREAGLPETTIAAIKAGDEPDFSAAAQDPDVAADSAAWALASELHHTHVLSDATYAAAVAAFGEQGVAELISLAGFYTLVSMTLNGFSVGLPEGAELPFPDAPTAVAAQSS